MRVGIAFFALIAGFSGALATAQADAVARIECVSRKPVTNDLLTTKFDPTIPSLERVTAASTKITSEQPAEPVTEPVKDIYISKTQICGMQIEFASECTFQEKSGDASYTFEFVCGDKVAGHVSYYYNMIEYLCRFGADGAKAEQLLFPGCKLN